MVSNFKRWRYFPSTKLNCDDEWNVFRTTILLIGSSLDSRDFSTNSIAVETSKLCRAMWSGEDYRFDSAVFSSRERIQMDFVCFRWNERRWRVLQFRMQQLHIGFTSKAALSGMPTKCVDGKRVRRVVSALSTDFSRWMHRKCAAHEIWIHRRRNWRRTKNRCTSDAPSDAPCPGNCCYRGHDCCAAWQRHCGQLHKSTVHAIQLSHRGQYLRNFREIRAAGSDVRVPASIENQRCDRMEGRLRRFLLGAEAPAIQVCGVHLPRRGRRAAFQSDIIDSGRRKWRDDRSFAGVLSELGPMPVTRRVGCCANVLELSFAYLFVARKLRRLSIGTYRELRMYSVSSEIRWNGLHLSPRSPRNKRLLSSLTD